MTECQGDLLDRTPSSWWKLNKRELIPEHVS